MSVTQNLMKIGSFRVRLTDDAPYRARTAAAMFDHIVITGTRLMPIDGFTDANILANSIYTGVITKRRDSGRIMSGNDLSYWLGTDEEVGDVLDTAVTQSAATLSTWVTALCPSSLTVGTVTNTGLSTLSRAYQWITRRKALDAVCYALGAEWRVRPDFAIDAADPTLLFRATPQTVITRKPEGRDGGLYGLEASEVVVDEDVEDYTTRAICVARGMRTGAASIAAVYKDGRNNDVVMERLVNAADEDPLNALAVAGSVVDQYNPVRKHLRLSSRTFAINRFVTPGDWIYAYDQLAGLTDSANQITFRGETVTPALLRVFGVTWPLEQGMGVYVRRSGATPTYTDISDYVDWEDGDEVAWDVGTSFRNLTSTGAMTGAGVSQAVAERSAAGKVPGVRCRHTTGENVATGTNTYLAWDSDDYDTDVFHDNATNNTRITIPANLSGTFAVGYSALIVAGTQTFSCWIEVNRGTTRFAWVQTPNDPVNGVLLQGSDFLALSAGDYIEVRAFQNSGGTLAVNGNTSCSFWLYRVGD